MDEARLDQLLALYRLKDETRTGWGIRGVTAPETVAAHSWGVSFLTLLYGQQADIDTQRALELAIVHDVAEAETGDLPTRAEEEQQEVSHEEKVEHEQHVIERFSAAMDFTPLTERWAEYSAKETRESRFVKDMDKIDMVLQATLYEHTGRYDPSEENPAFTEYEHMDEFFATTEQRLSTDIGKQLFVTIRDRYEQVKQG